MIEVVYARQSVEQKNSLSIDGQIDLCEKISGGPLEPYIDRGYSGKNTERPDFKRLMADVKAGKVKKIYVYRLDRISRSVADFGRIWETLRENHVEFVSISENFDTTTPMGRAMLHIIMVFAQLERETTAERVKDNYYRRAQLGRWPGGPAPYGYSNSKIIGDDGLVIPTITPNENAAIVKRIFEEYAKKDTSLTILAKMLSEEKIPSAKRDTWDTVTLSRILHNPTYVKASEEVFLYYKSRGANVMVPLETFDGEHGVLIVGKRESNERKYTEVKDHQVSILNSIGIVSSEVWLACQTKLENNRQIGNNGRGTHTWLSGLLKCGKCGYSIKVVCEKNRRWLLCSGRYNANCCTAKISLKLTELEDHIQEQLEQLLAECPEPELPTEENDEIRQRLEALDAKADRLTDAFSESDDLSPAYFKRALARIEEEREKLLEEQKQKQEKTSLPKNLSFSTLSFEEKKIVAKQFIKRINLIDDSAEIIWNV